MERKKKLAIVFFLIACIFTFGKVRRVFARLGAKICRNFEESQFFDFMFDPDTSVAKNNFTSVARVEQFFVSEKETFLSIQITF